MGKRQKKKKREGKRTKGKLDALLEIVGKYQEAKKRLPNGRENIFCLRIVALNKMLEELYSHCSNYCAQLQIF